MLDSINKNLISILQSSFPLVKQPYYEIGKKLNISTEEVIYRLTKYKESGLVREISAIANPHMLGYTTTLVAIKIPSQAIKRGTEIICSHPFISHAYLRNHEFNLWITLAARKDQNIAEEIEKIRLGCNATTAISLPSTRVFKLKAVFDETNKPLTEPIKKNKPATIELSPKQKRVLKIIQSDLPLSSTPFYELSREMDIRTDEFLDVVRELIGAGVVKRYGASVNHRRLGYEFNAMTCFCLDNKTAESLGKYFSRQEQVSHCYLRKPHKLFPQNFFAMVHCANEVEHSLFMQKVASETGHREYLSLVSEGEIKKQRNRYYS